MATKPAFRRAFRERRCLILADGFYEWQRQNGRKQPFYIRLRDGQPIDSCTIITTVANDLIQPLHIRMPVILAPEDYVLWLDADVRDVERLQTLLRPYPAEAMEAYPVSTRVNNRANDTPECVEPIAQ